MKGNSMSSTESTTAQSFADLGLSASLLKTLADIGYETPSPIQAECIPVLLQGRDLIGQAQTGTGKTAAFALPLMEQIDVKLTKPQALVLTPTRELAIQVAEALQSYAKNLPASMSCRSTAARATPSSSSNCHAAPTLLSVPRVASWITSSARRSTSTT
jgi:superfamily II DNA/RNA helicase